MWHLITFVFVCCDNIISYNFYKLYHSSAIVDLIKVSEGSSGTLTGIASNLRFHHTNA